MMSDEMWRNIATEDNTRQLQRMLEASKILRDESSRESEQPQYSKGVYVHEPAPRYLYAHEMTKTQVEMSRLPTSCRKALSSIYHIYNDVPEATIESANPAWICSQMKIAHWVSREREISRNFFDLLQIRSEAFHRRVPKISKAITRKNHYEVIKSVVAGSSASLSNEFESMFDVSHRRAFTAHLARFLVPGRFDWNRLYVEETKSWWVEEDIDEKTQMPPLLMFTRRHLVQVVSTAFDNAGINLSAGAWAKLAQWIDDEKKSSSGQTCSPFEAKDSQLKTPEDIEKDSLLSVRCTQMDIMAWARLNAAVTELVVIMEQMEKADETKLKNSSDTRMSVRHSEESNAIWRNKITPLMTCASKEIKVLQRSGGSCGASEAIFSSFLNLQRFIDAPWQNDSSISFVDTFRRFERSFRYAMDIKKGSLTVEFALCGTGMTVFKFVRMVFEKITRERPVFDLLRGQNVVGFPSTLSYYGGRIKSLDLSRNCIKQLDDDVGCLVHLKQLDVSDNHIEEIDASIGQLEALEVLRCGQNRLKKLPEEIGRLESLRILDLSNNDLKALPASMKKLSSLEVLNVSGNSIDAQHIRTILGRIQGLKVITREGSNLEKV